MDWSHETLGGGQGHRHSRSPAMGMHIVHLLNLSVPLLSRL